MSFMFQAFLTKFQKIKSCSSLKWHGAKFQIKCFSLRLVSSGTFFSRERESVFRKQCDLALHYFGALRLLGNKKWYYC